MIVGHVSTLWDVLVFRASPNRWVVGDKYSVFIKGMSIQSEEAIQRISDLQNS